MTDELASRLVNTAIDVEDSRRLQRIIQPFERTHPRHDKSSNVPVLVQGPAIRWHGLNMPGHPEKLINGVPGVRDNP